MAIATLIAAGRLDDRLLDRALGLLRESPARALAPGSTKATPPTSLLQGDPRPRAAALEALGWRRCRRPARRAAPEAAVRRRHGFDHDRPGMHRRAGRLCRAQGRSRGRSPSGRCRASSISPARWRSGSRCSTGSTKRIARCLAERVRPDRGRGDAGRDDACRRFVLTLLVSGGFLSFAEPVAASVASTG